MSAPSVLGERALNRALLQRQWLTERQTASVTEALAHLVGLQSQAPDPPYVGLWTRLAEFGPDDLGRLITDRSAVRTALMRGTLHTANARDALALRQMLQPMLEQQVEVAYRRRLAGVPAAEIGSAGATLAASGGTWTFAQITETLAQQWPQVSRDAFGTVVRDFVPLAQVPPRGLWRTSGPAAHVPLKSWLDGTEADPMTVDELTTRYLAAFGPATVADLQAWCGLTRLGPRVKKLAAEGVLRTYATEEGRLLFDVAGTELPDPDGGVPVRYLPEWDVLLLSHADRSRVMSHRAKAAVFTQNGIVRSTVLVDGTVRATWAVTTSDEAAVLVVSELEPLDGEARAEATEEGLRLLAFHSPDRRHEVRFGRRS